MGGFACGIVGSPCVAYRIGATGWPAAAAVVAAFGVPLVAVAVFDLADPVLQVAVNGLGGLVAGALLLVNRQYFLQLSDDRLPGMDLVGVDREVRPLRTALAWLRHTLRIPVNLPAQAVVTLFRVRGRDPSASAFLRIRGRPSPVTDLMAVAAAVVYEAWAISSDLRNGTAAQLVVGPDLALPAHVALIVPVHLGWLFLFVAGWSFLFYYVRCWFALWTDLWTTPPPDPPAATAEDPDMDAWEDRWQVYTGCLREAAGTFFFGFAAAVLIVSAVLLYWSWQSGSLDGLPPAIPVGLTLMAAFLGIYFFSPSFAAWDIVRSTHARLRYTVHSTSPRWAGRVFTVSYEEVLRPMHGSPRAALLILATYTVQFALSAYLQAT